VSALHIEAGAGHPSSLTLERRVKLLLIKQLVGESNRMFANMLTVFSMISDIDVSYRAVERLYSGPEVILAIHNLHVLILSKKGARESDATCDGTGRSLTIRRNYESYAQELRDRAKGTDDVITNNDRREGRIKAQAIRFAYMFALMDLRARMYMAYGSSMKSEKDDRAMGMVHDIDIISIQSGLTGTILRQHM